MIECTDIFWPHFAKGAGVMLGEEAMQEARTREYQVRDSHYRVIQGGQG